jgi:hypothetical protein
MQTRPTQRRFLAAAVAALITAIAPLAAQNRAPQTTSDVPKIQFEKYTLPNGLEVILSEDHRLPIVAVNLWYHVGPANEAAGPHRVRPSVRAPDVPGLEAHATRLAFPDARGRRCNGNQWHDRLRPY